MMKTCRISIAWALLPLLAICGGCLRPQSPTTSQLDLGLVWMFPGIEGHPAMLGPARQALRDAGVNAAVEVYEWHRPGMLGSIHNLQDESGNRAKAAELAASISEYSRHHPSRPIDLIGYSGGSGLAIMVAEALPESARLHHVILLQAAVSPDYDLTPVLRRLDGKLVNFYSPLDWAFLGVGTSLFGTMDRKYEPAAGKLGFNPLLAAPDEKLRQHLEQHCWNAEMFLAGHYGGHLGPFSYNWSRKYLAPLLLPEPDSGSRTGVTGLGGPDRLVGTHAVNTFQ